MNEKEKIIVEAAKSKLGDPYVFGAWGEECAPAIRKQYAGYNPAHAANIKKKCQVLNGDKSSCAGCKWEGHLCYDCRGFTYYLLKQVGIYLQGAGATSQWNAKVNWDAKGAIKDGLPDLVCCLFKANGSTMEHTGMHIGSGDIIHCSSGVQTGRVTDKGWTHWAVPKGLYSEDELKNAGVVKKMQTIRKGDNGETVKFLQETLGKLGFSLEADGKFGSQTMGAVATFQEQNGLTVDGIVGAKTWAALDAALAAYEEKQALTMKEAVQHIADVMSNPESEHGSSGLTTDEPESKVEQLQDEIAALKKTLDGVRGVVQDLVEVVERLKYAVK